MKISKKTKIHSLDVSQASNPTQLAGVLTFIQEVADGNRDDVEFIVKNIYNNTKLTAKLVTAAASHQVCLDGLLIARLKQKKVWKLEQDLMDASKINFVTPLFSTGESAEHIPTTLSEKDLEKPYVWICLSKELGKVYIATTKNRNTLPDFESLVVDIDKEVEEILQPKKSKRPARRQKVDEPKTGVIVREEAEIQTATDPLDAFFVDPALLSDSQLYFMLALHNASRVRQFIEKTCGEVPQDLTALKKRVRSYMMKVRVELKEKRSVGEKLLKRFETRVKDEAKLLEAKIDLRSGEINKRDYNKIAGNVKGNTRILHSIVALSSEQENLLGRFILMTQKALKFFNSLEDLPFSIQNCDPEDLNELYRQGILPKELPPKSASYALYLANRNGGIEEVDGFSYFKQDVLISFRENTIRVPYFGEFEMLEPVEPTDTFVYRLVFSDYYGCTVLEPVVSKRN